MTRMPRESEGKRERESGEGGGRWMKRERKKRDGRGGRKIRGINGRREEKRREMKRETGEESVSTHVSANPNL